MGLLDRLKGGIARWVVVGGPGRFRDGYVYQNDTLASNETIFSAISMLSGAMASLPVSLRRDAQRVTAEDHPVAALLEYGLNPYLTTFQFIRSMETLRDATGAGYALRELDGRGRTTALWILKTECVTPVLERDTRELYYHIRDSFSGEDAYIHNSLVLAVSHISTDGIHPVSPIDVLKSSLQYDKEVKEFSVDQMREGLRAKIAISLQKNLSQDQLDEYSEVIRRFKKSGILYLDAGKTIQELRGSNVIDPKVFEVENITIARVARVYNIPLEKFLTDKAKYSSAEQSDLNYLRDTVLPMVRMYEQEFTAKLLSQQERASGMRIKFSLNGFARADMQTRGEFYQKGVRSGWFCLDDIRDLEDLPPLPDGLGQEFYISKDLIPVRQLMHGGGKGDDLPWRTY